MKKRIAFLIFYILFSTYTKAHPHAFISMTNKVLVEKGNLVGFSVQWILDEVSSAGVLYDLKQIKDPKELQNFIDSMMKNIITEHYFSYFFDKQGNKIKYLSKPKNYGMKSNGSEALYYFDFLLSQPQKLENNVFELSTYDESYYVSMYYDKEQIKKVVDFSQLPKNCRGSVIEPNVDQKIKEYALSLDKSQAKVDTSLGKVFAQRVVITCE